MLLFTIPKTFLWAGMANQSLIGCTSYMDWESSTSAKFVETLAIGVVVPFKCIFKNGATLTG
jgi:hypothetical protein